MVRLARLALFGWQLRLVSISRGPLFQFTFFFFPLPTSDALFLLHCPPGPCRERMTVPVSAKLCPLEAGEEKRTSRFAVDELNQTPALLVLRESRLLRETHPPWVQGFKALNAGAREHGSTGSNWPTSERLWSFL
ncbi:hypothetical protein EDB81DRAFT_174545 [Dactylonectria macrodidyma]|uniref:Uncharacterized protein n=1 Tax=Dactylonectria macrodidyma TaxID=307937 RepID=A0A9P9JHD6_9HYPO|nr:hypothetical protein EDB81DRAFT_174545 [Dactylonectria macrodidyma]